MTLGELTLTITVKWLQHDSTTCQKGLFVVLLLWPPTYGGEYTTTYRQPIRGALQPLGKEYQCHFVRVTSLPYVPRRSTHFESTPFRQRSRRTMKPKPPVAPHFITHATEGHCGQRKPCSGNCPASRSLNENTLVRRLS